MTAPADLAAQVSRTRDHLRDLRIGTAELGRAYAQLDAATLTTDTLGHPITAEQALAAVHEALADLDRALALADDAATVVQSYTDRLMER